MTENKGITLVLLAAFVSGFSIFLNSFAVASFNAFVFTTLKNAIVAVFLFSLVLLLKEIRNLKTISKKQWLQLSTIGLVGGSIPFLLYFYALKLTTAINAGFLHKTLFIWASVLAFFFLKERISKQFLVGAVLLFIGNLLVFSQFGSFGFPELLILVATALWATESVLAKNILKELSGKITAFGRMFFGSLFLLAFLATTNQIPLVFELTTIQLQWILLTSALLFFYVFFWYNGLKHLNVAKATSLLLLAQPITAVLSIAFLDKTVSLNQALGLFLIVLGAITIVGFSFLLKLFGWRALYLAGRE
jgi:drug/metabolite transporter (DMT)-like permease